MIKRLNSLKNIFKDYIRKKLLDKLLWATTEHADKGKFIKYSAQSFWSFGALKRVLENKNEVKKPFESLRYGLSAPKKIIKNSIINLQDKTAKNIFNI